MLGIAAVAALALLAANSDTKKITEDERLTVVASFYPMYFFASTIGGEEAHISNLTPPGVEPHDFEPTTQDIAHVHRSALLVLNGAVEAWGERLQEELRGTNTRIVVAGEGLFTQAIKEEGETMSDPHIWLDPVLAQQEVHAIAQGFIQADPSHADRYAAREAELITKLDALDIRYRTGLAQCERRDFITSHAAFAYLADRYGLTQTAIAGLSPEEEPSPRTLATIADFARAHDIRYIFFETLVSPKLSETVARDIGAQTLVLDPIEGIRAEAQVQGTNYFTIMEQNLANLRIALVCQ